MRNLNKKRQTEREMTPAEIRKPTVSKETEYAHCDRSDVGCIVEFSHQGAAPHSK